MLFCFLKQRHRLAPFAFVSSPLDFSRTHKIQFGSSALREKRVCNMLMRIDTLLSGLSQLRTFYPAIIMATLFGAFTAAPRAESNLSRPITVDALCAPAAQGVKSCKISFFMQPYQATRFIPPFGDNVEAIATYVEKYTGKRPAAKEPALSAKFSKIDKSQALAEIALPTVPEGETTTVLVAQNTKTGALREIQVRFTEQKPAEIPLVVLDSLTAGHRFVTRIATGKQPKSAMFISPTRVVLPLLDDNHIEVIDVLTRQTTRLELPAEYAKRGGFVESVVVGPRGEFWVSQMKAAAIHRFSVQTLEYLGSIKLTGTWTKVLAYNPVLNVVYASNWNSSDISIVSIDTLQEIKKIKIGGVPRGMAFSADGKSMLAAIFGGKNDGDGAGRTVMVDLEQNKITHTIIQGGANRHAVRLKTGADLFAVSDMMRSKVYFITQNAKVAETKVFNNPNTIAESNDGKYLYVSCRGKNNPKSYLIKGPDFGKLMVIDIATQQVVEEIEAGNQPTGLDVSPDGKYIVLTDFLDHAMRVYERVK